MTVTPGLQADGRQRNFEPDAAIILAIETSGSTCSAAIARGSQLLAAHVRPMRHGHAEALLPIIDEAMADAGLTAEQLDIVAAATGPGGFTGIRVGLAAAQGIALATTARLTGVSSFAAVAAGLCEIEPKAPGVLLVALDSRRADLYVQLFAAKTAAPLAEPAALLPEDLAGHVARVAGDARLLIAGDAAVAAARAIGGQPGGDLVADLVPEARGVAAAVRCRLCHRVPLEPARPLYLRPPDVTLPKRPPAPANPP